jgi:hypothetical protein
MPKPNYSLEDIEDLHVKGWLSKEDRMLLRQDYYREVNRDPTIVESIADAVMTPIRMAQKVIDDSLRDLREQAATRQREQQERDRVFAERQRKLTEEPSPIDKTLEVWKAEQTRQIEALKAARDLPRVQQRPQWGALPRPLPPMKVGRAR